MYSGRGKSGFHFLSSVTVPLKKLSPVSYHIKDSKLRSRPSLHSQGDKIESFGSSNSLFVFRFWAKKILDRVIQSLQIQRFDKEMFDGQTGQLIQVYQIWICRNEDDFPFITKFSQFGDHLQTVRFLQLEISDDKISLGFSVTFQGFFRIPGQIDTVFFVQDQEEGFPDGLIIIDNDYLFHDYLILVRIPEDEN
jgi:hypothetical protein